MDERNDFDRKYVATRLPDKLKLAEYIKEAKGPGRTMAEFAKQCGTLSAPSFSRIIKGNLVKPLSVEIIQSIVKNAAPGARVDYESMMRANGMVPEDLEKEESDVTVYRERAEQEKNMELQVRNIIADEHFARGHMIQYFPGLPEDVSPRHEYLSPIYIPKSRFGLSVPSSFTIRIQGHEPLFWNYDVNLHGVNLHVPERDKLAELPYASFFLRDTWEPETLKDVKQSFVFVDKGTYQAFLSLLSGVKVHNNVSVLLVDLKAGRIVEEHFLDRYDGKQMDSVFLEKRME
ncbi:MAG: hypothetical protein IJ661_03345 [Lachnospiraceae bacterium]|nr:hypothetical protein [Lachnospiraceae bacterium]